MAGMTVSGAQREMRSTFLYGSVGQAVQSRSMTRPSPWAFAIGSIVALAASTPLQAQVADCLWPAPPQFLANRASAPDSTLVHMGRELVKVCYSRPSARGRTIFGELVPYGRVWRTGADEPTTLYLSTAAVVAGVELEAGRSFLLTVPDEEEWTILLHRSSGTTAAAIFADLNEVGRGVVGVEVLDEHVETFTIHGTGDARGAELVLEWERSRVRIPVRLLEPAGRVHRAASADGTEIVGRVRGEGPPLILVHGGLGDGELSWKALLPFLERHFTTYLMSTRGRGLSAEPAQPDYSLERLVEDVVAFAESVAERSGAPVGVFGYSLGGALGLGAAARTDAIRVLAVYEPPVLEALTEETAVGFAESTRGMTEAAADGRLADAARALLEPIAREDEMEALEEAGAFEAWARNVPVALLEIEEATQAEGPGPTAASTLDQIRVPTQYLLGSRAHAWHRDGAGYLAEQLEGLRVVEVDDVGHFGPVLSPEPIADELIRFFGTHLRAAP